MALKPTRKATKAQPRPPVHVGGYVGHKPPGFWVPRTPKPVARLGRIHIWSDDPQLDVTGWLSDERPNVDSGYGGWEEVPRPRRRPVTTFRGLPGLHLSLPILLNGWSKNQSQEGQISNLEKLAGRDVNGLVATSDGEPPLVYVDSPGGAVPHKGRTWVISDLTWGEALVNENGDRVRQQVTVSLLEYVADVNITERSAAKRQRAKAVVKNTKPGAKKKRVVAKHAASKKTTGATLRSSAAAADDFGGEDLLSLAARELGDANRWVEIAMLNGLRDPRAIVPGQVLRLP